MKKLALSKKPGKAIIKGSRPVTKIQDKNEMITYSGRKM